MGAPPEQGAPRLVVTGLTKTFGRTRALVDVSLIAQAGDVHALLGANGAGKSTLIKILAGAYAADAGTVAIDGQTLALRSPAEARDHGIAVIHQQLSVIPSLTVAENFLIKGPGGAHRGRPDRAGAARVARERLQQFDVDFGPETLVEQLAFSERQMLEIAIATSQTLKLLVMDEPTSGLSRHEQVALFTSIRAMASAGVSILYVSHKMNEVFEISDRITVLRNGERVADFPPGGIDRAAVVAAIVGRTAAPSAADASAGHTALPPRAGDTGPAVLTVRDLSTNRIRGISFHVDAGEVVGVYGVVGSGCPQLAEAVVGARPCHGYVAVAGQRRRLRTTSAARAASVNFVPSDHRTRGAVAEMSIEENALLGRGQWRRGFPRRITDSTRALVADATGRLRVKCADLGQNIDELSGGNQQKVVFARSVLDRPRLLVLEDPTQGIDVGAKIDMFDEIRRQRDAGVAILLISSEVSELSGIADRVLVLRDGTIVSELTGTDIDDEQILARAAS